MSDDTRRTLLEKKIRDLEDVIRTHAGTRKIEDWAPWPHQQKGLDFIRAGKKTILLQGANRIGKTVFGSCFVGSACLGIEPWSGEPTIFGKVPIRARIIAVDWEHHAKEVIVPALKEWLPTGTYETRKNNVGVETYWDFPETKSTIELMTHSQETRIHEGWKGHIVWCIAGNQRVLTESGSWVPISDIRPGDTVWGTFDNGLRQLRTVTAHQRREASPTVIVKTKGCPNLVCTPEHKISTRRGWVAAGSLVAGDQIYFPHIPEATKNISVEKNLAFMLGLWIGDGWNSNRSLFVSISEFNSGFISLVASKNEKLTHAQRNDFRVINRDLRSLIKDSRLWGVKAGKKFIPPEVFTWDAESRKAFLGGLFSADGWVSGHVVGYGSTSYRLVEDVWLMLHGLGIKSTFNFKPSQKPGRWADQWHLIVAKSADVLRLLDAVPIEGKTNFPERVRAEAMRRANSRGSLGCGLSQQRRNSLQFRRVISVDAGPETETYDIAVKGIFDRRKSGCAYRGEHSFVCQGMRVANSDEPLPKDKYTANKRGLIDYSGVFIMTMTALYEPWILDEIVLSNSSSVGCVLEVPMRANPLLRDDDIKNFSQGLSEEELAVRVAGGWLQLSGLILKKFDRDKNVVPDFSVPVDWPVIAMIDIHLNKPQAVGFYAWDKYDRQYVVEEIWEHLTPEKIGDEIVKRKFNYPRMREAYIDPLAKGDNEFVKNRVNIEDTYTIIERKLAPYGIRLHVGSKDKASGIQNINTKFEGVNKMPSLFFLRRCVRHIYEASRWIYDKDGKPQDENDHFMENLYRSTLVGMKYTPPGLFSGDLKYEESGVV